MFIKPLSLALRQDEKEAPVLSFDAGEYKGAEQELYLTAKNLVLGARRLGGLSLHAKPGTAQFGLDLGISELKNPVLSFEVRDDAERHLHVALSPVELGALGKALAVDMPLPTVNASGSIDAQFPKEFTPNASVNGRTDVTLKGYVPPHPVELDGFVFGDRTDIGARFRVEPAKLRIELEDVLVKAGSFELKGSGGVGLEVGGPHLRLNLSGALPCASLASAAAQTRLGAALGRLTGKAARETLNGAVQVQVRVDANLLEPDKPRVSKTITPGCGLKPLSLRELRALGELAPDLLDPAVGNDLEKLLKNGVPPLPNLGPDTKIDLSQLPKVPLPTLPLPTLPLATPSAKKLAAPEPAASGR
ncbi:MAG: hypothetical protein QM756_46365 [Polyangiaceae bacterium]